MLNSKLIRILNVCTKEEKKELEKCINSPFFNESTDITRLWNYLKPMNFSESPKKLKKEYIFGQLFPDESYNDPKMRRLMSGLIHVVEKYFFNKTHQDSFLYHEQLAQLYYTRYMKSELEHEVKELIKMNELSPFRNKEYYDNQVIIEKYKMYLEFIGQKIRKGKEDRNISEVLKSRDIAYLLNQLDLICALKNNRKTLNIVTYQGFSEYVLQYVETNPEILEPVIFQIYWRFYKLYNSTTISMEEILELQDFIENNIELLHHNEATYFRALMRNIVFQLARENHLYFKPLFEIYKRHLEKGDLFNYNKITPNVFHSVVQAALSVHEIVWVENFMLKYEKHLPENLRESTLAFCNALVEFHKKRYVNALKYLQSAEKIPNPLFELEARTLYLQTVFQLNDELLLSNAIERMKAYLQRSVSVSDEARKSYKEFFHYTSLIYHSKNASDYSKLIRIKAEIENTSRLPHKQWLLSLV